MNDQMVVAAFNSCLDLNKWNTLPSNIRNRFGALLRGHRLKFVCFSKQLGLGLKVYNEPGTDESPEGSDEALMGTLQQVDLDGRWVRCPGSMYVENEEYLVLNETGTKYLITNVTDPSYDEGDLIEWTTSTMSSSRTRARTFTSKAIAQNAATIIKGVVIKK